MQAGTRVLQDRKTIVSALDEIAGGLTHNILGATGLLKLLKPSRQSR